MNTRAIKLTDPPISLLQARAMGQAILLIHGNSSCKEVFKKQIFFLNRLGMTVVVPDLPGHGASDDAEDPPSAYSFPGYANVLLRTMRTLGFETFHVLGWSLGGHIGIELWTCPSVLSLTISGTPPVRLSPDGAAKGFIGASIDYAGRLDFTEDDAREYSTSMMGERLGDDDHLMRMLRRTDGRARHWMVRNGLNGVGRDQVATVESVGKPLAIIQGASDCFVNIPYLCGLNYCNLWGNAPVLLPGGHAPHWLNPDEFNFNVKKFLLQLL